MPDFCGVGDVTTIVNIDTVIDPALPAACLRPSGVGTVFGDVAAEAIVCGYDVTQGLSGEFLRRSGKKWRWTRNGSTSDYPDPGLITARLSSAPNFEDITVTLEVFDPGNPTPQSTSFTVIGVGKTMQPLLVTFSTSVPREALISPAVYDVVRDVTIRASYAGQSATLNAVQRYGTTTTTPKAITNLEEKNSSFFEQPWMFYDCQMSVAKVRFGTVVADDLTNSSEIAFDRNFEDYVLPGYC